MARVCCSLCCSLLPCFPPHLACPSLQTRSSPPLYPPSTLLRLAYGHGQFSSSGLVLFIICSNLNSCFSHLGVRKSHSSHYIASEVAQRGVDCVERRV